MKEQPQAAAAPQDQHNGKKVPGRGFVSRHFGRWMALGQFGFPFSLGPYPTAVARFRALARRTRFPGRTKQRILARVAMTFAWPIAALREAHIIRARMQARGQAPHGMRTLLDMYWLALRYSIPPIEYGLYRFNEPMRRLQLHDYIYINDLPGLAALNVRSQADNRDVQDKHRFAELCVANGFPRVPTLATFEHGTQTWPDTQFVPSEPKLWSKSLHLKGGAGAMKWTKDGEGYRNNVGRYVAAADIGAAFGEQDCLIQPFVENHPVIARTTNGALASLRIVTGLSGDGKAEFVASLLCLPHGACTTSVGGIMCAIDTETGRIVRAAYTNARPVTDHPDTGVPIPGTIVPFWHESMEMALRAHASAFSRFAFLGWDIALTEHGPIFLETNSGWGAIFHQMLEGPIGLTAFTRLVSRHV